MGFRVCQERGRQASPHSHEAGACRQPGRCWGRLVGHLPGGCMRGLRQGLRRGHRQESLGQEAGRGKPAASMAGPSVGGGAMWAGTRGEGDKTAFPDGSVLLALGLDSLTFNRCVCNFGKII